MKNHKEFIKTDAKNKFPKPNMKTVGSENKPMDINEWFKYISESTK